DLDRHVQGRRGCFPGAGAGAVRRGPGANADPRGRTHPLRNRLAPFCGPGDVVRIRLAGDRPAETTMTQAPEERVRRLPFAFSQLDPAVRREVTWLDASDTAQSFGILYRPPSGDPKTAVYLMHPRGEFTRHYVVPGLTARGYAVFGHNSRYLNTDTDMVHERLLFDIAAGMRWLK